MSYVLVDGIGIETTLVGSTAPRPVQVVIEGLSAGQSVVVHGSSGGRSWPIPGGAFAAVEGQVVLVDNRAPVNVPITYAVTVDGVTINSAPVTVAYHADHLLQSLDGRTVVDFVWRDNSLPYQSTVRSVTFDVPGRRRPPVRFAPGGDGGGRIEVRTDSANTGRMADLLRPGRPVVLRTNGSVRDFPPTELVLVQQASSVLYEAFNARDNRVWDMAFIFVDDPEPGTVVAAFTWEDFDAAWDGRTWEDFDAYFSGLTWDDLDRMDWTELL